MFAITIVRTGIVAGLVAGFALAATPAASAAPPTAPTVYVDCAASPGGDGSQGHPLNSIDAVDSLELSPGESVLFRRGTTCDGELAPQGKGTPAAPITIGDYGDSRQRAVIDANGATNAVLLKNNAYLKLTKLELVAPGDNLTPRRGVYVYGDDGGTLAGLRLEALYIHDVRGQLPAVADPGNLSSFKGKGPDASGGIIVDAEGSKTPTAFSGLTIVNNRIDDVDRQGIYFWSNWCRRPQLSRWADLCTAPWFPDTDVLVAGNHLSSIGGDGLVITGSQGATVEHNLLDGFNRRAGSYDAGIWTANSTDVLMQYNTVTGGTGTLDSQAFDIDHATSDVTVRYNFSHDNDGGFMLTCPDAGGTHDFLVYGNISVNDSTRVIQHGCGGPIYNGKFFNNTIYTDHTSANVWDDSGVSPDVEIFNNIFVATGTGKLTFVKPSDGLTIHDNLMSGFSPPSGATRTLTGEPDLFAPGGDDPADYRLGPDSAALGAGVATAIPVDYFGSPMPTSAPPNMGAYQGKGLERSEANGCVLQLSAPAATVQAGTASIDLAVTNPCLDAFAGSAVTATMSPDFSLVGSPVSPVVAAGETRHVTVPVAIPDTITPGTYAVALSLGGESTTVNVTVPSGWTQRYGEDFSNVAIGTLPSGWYASSPGSAGVVAADGGRALSIQRIAGATNVVRWDFGAVQPTARVEMRVRAAQTGGAIGLQVLDASQQPVARVSMADLGVWAFTNGNTFINTTDKYVANTWYDVAIVVRATDYDVYIDGALLGTGSTTGGRVPTSLRVQIPSSVTVPSTFLVDDITIATPIDDGATHVPAAVEPAIDPTIAQRRPASVDAGRSLGLLLAGFRPDELVTITSTSTSTVKRAGAAVAGSVPTAEAVSDADGTVRAALPIPSDQPAGPITVTAMQSMFGPRLTATTTATVVSDVPPGSGSEGDGSGGEGTTPGGTGGTGGQGAGGISGAGPNDNAGMPSTQNAAGRLSDTGSDLVGPFLGGALIVAAGAATMLIARRRRRIE
ncbi:hypothetical protein GCM10028798_00900 [Humibacter antri]